MANRLANANSPYLLQHRDNPVDWFEWGAEAFADAAERDVPILLSVGYASCHWCHVMAHESFANEDTAALMNDLFVNVKVDREERPDVDRVYMDAVQTMTGRGGWPMTVFLTPEGEPFYAGTYFPPHDRPGMPSFARVLEGVSQAWKNDRQQVVDQAAKLVASIRTSVPASDDLPDAALLADAYAAIAAGYDPDRGGFGGAPKFPQAPTLEFLLRSSTSEWAPQAIEMVSHTLEAMAAGGIYDHIGGGFSRYSVDARWLVPHFEKMLYDNALLALLYTHAYQATGRKDFRRVAIETLTYMDRDLSLGSGGFASAEDADSEGVEGKFYVFSHADIIGAAPSHAEAVATALGSSPGGNFEGDVIVHQAVAIAAAADNAGVDENELADAIAATKAALYGIRSTRVRPQLDDKAVCAWNGLAIRAFAKAGVVFGEAPLIERAEVAARFVLAEMRSKDGSLHRTWREGRTSGAAYADDYGALALGLFGLYQATGDPEWFHEADSVTRTLLDRFWDPVDGGVFATDHDAEKLIARPKNLFDNPTPSDNSLAAEAVQHLHAYTGDPDLIDRLDDLFRAGGRMMSQYPTGVGHLLGVALVGLSGPRQLAIVGEAGRDELLSQVTGRYSPDLFVACTDEPSDLIPLLEGRSSIDGMATAYLCRDMVCNLPTTDAAELTSQLG